jgi:hypothetical protein
MEMEGLGRQMRQREQGEDQEEGKDADRNTIRWGKTI